MTKLWKLELAVGLFVIAGMIALFVLAMQVSNFTQSGSSVGYRLTAYFDNVGSLKARAPVSMSGVRVGRVESIGLDPTSFRAVVTLKIDAAFDQIPADTFASVFTAGLLGEQYIALAPGGSFDVLTDGDTIEHTQSALVLEQMIGNFLFSRAAE